MHSGNVGKIFAVGDAGLRRYKDTSTGLYFFTHLLRRISKPSKKNDISPMLEIFCLQSTGYGC